MGYCLPAAIGVARASGGEVVCVTGEGSLQMNLQELQTIRHNRFPIKLFVINNEGYHSIRQTQMSFFGEPLVGVGEESGDLSFPELAKACRGVWISLQKPEKQREPETGSHRSSRAGGRGYL